MPVRVDNSAAQRLPKHQPLVGHTPSARGLTPYPPLLPLTLTYHPLSLCVSPTHPAGIEFPKLQPAAFDGVRGLAAKADIAADDIIVSVPRQAALTLPPKQRCPCPVSHS